ncbi:MAG: Asp23/Gls24 family envelope stress response protein [Eggerthellaceae bacterium]|nr:Asp23/Gls24 family envelope stress response protein [Eggerthellaceae bacterium]
MTKNMNVNGMSLAPGVVETIISIAAGEVEGVASVGSFAAGGIRAKLTAKPATSGIEVEADAEGKLTVTLHVEVYHGHVLPELAANLRQAIADALLVQVGLEVAAIDIFIDGIQFAA